MVTNKKFFGIKFPFKNSESGYYFDLTTSSKDAVRSNLSHLLLTKKGNRLYKPDFGTNIQNYLFEQMDNQTFDALKNEIITSVQKNLSGITIDSIEIMTEEKTVNLKVNYSYNDGVFLVKDILSLNF